MNWSRSENILLWLNLSFLFFFFFLLYNIFTIRDYGSRFRLLASSLASLGFSLGSFRTTGQNLISHPPRWTIIAISMLSLSLPMTFPPGVKFSSFVLLHGFSRWGKLFGKLQIFHRSRESIEILFRPKQILLVRKILSINYIIGVQVVNFDYSNCFLFKYLMKLTRERGHSSKLGFCTRIMPLETAHWRGYTHMHKKKRIL